VSNYLALVGLPHGAASSRMTKQSVLQRRPDPIRACRRNLRNMSLPRLAILLCALTLATPALTARCGGDFSTFVSNISAEAQAAGISPGVTSAAFGGVTEDAAVLNFDRRQRYNKSFDVSARVSPKPT
jgi:membrane-bound lytic murein transglycosylase B